jgi:hypothetical protein
MIVNGFFTYAGVEANAVHVDDLRDPPARAPARLPGTRAHDDLHRRVVLASVVACVVASWDAPSAIVSGAICVAA